MAKKVKTIVVNADEETIKKIVKVISKKVKVKTNVNDGVVFISKDK